MHWSNTADYYWISYYWSCKVGLERYSMSRHDLTSEIEAFPDAERALWLHGRHEKPSVWILLNFHMEERPVTFGVSVLLDEGHKWPSMQPWPQTPCGCRDTMGWRNILTLFDYWGAFTGVLRAHAVWNLFLKIIILIRNHLKNSTPCKFKTSFEYCHISTRL